ncbi:MAG: O-antigen ligase family protein [Bacteroidales bacterium]
MNPHAQENISGYKTKAFLVLGSLFVIASSVLLAKGSVLFILLPVMLIAGWLFFTSIDTFLLVTLFLTPLSIQLRFIVEEPPADLFIPTELFLTGILIIMIFKLFITKEIDRRILRHPVTLVSGAMLIWAMITSVTGTMLLVSLKNFIARTWFFIGFYLLATQIFLKPENIRRYFTAYITGMIPVIFWYISKMYNAGLFNQQAAYKSTLPFFNDHTALGAAIAFCIPVIIFFFFSGRKSLLRNIVLVFLLILFLFSFVISYSRAAWLSLFISIILVAVLGYGIRFKTIFLFSVIILLALNFSWQNIFNKISEVRHSSTSRVSKHIQSIANITTDVSNLERINRWKSAVRMWEERPLFGWGPGTYQFKYAPFQISHEKTIISTNYGEGGNAHSEYLGALAESGILGAVLYITLIFIAMTTAFKLARKMAAKPRKILVFALITGLSTYIVHGAMNNFLDTDKISALFWGMIAAIVATDINNTGSERDT